ncbi:hypothetical protein FQ707_08055 [Bacteroidaceae bacterium HV4-6-C5C]|jgi:hypothetical protein|nr:hypothetical protein FQ707_08055 [Bacteroidaceae bacterium HV4-6-C5C]
MNYLEWNNIISEYFFNSANAGKNIYLYTTKTDIIHLARIYFEEELDDEIWNDFIIAIKRGLPGSNGNITAKAKYAYEKRRLLSINSIEIKRPPYISYLVFFVIPLTEELDGAYSTNNYYDRLNGFLRANHINETIGTNDFRDNQINCLWENLADWANVKKNGDLGLFNAIPFTNLYWVYVGKVFSQCILPPKFLKTLPELFESIGLVPGTFYEDAFIKDKIKSSRTHLIPQNTLDFLKKDDEISKSIIQAIQREYKKWTGETHEEIEEGITLRKKKNFTIAPLFLQFKINTNDEEITFSYRMRSSNDYPEDLKFGEYQNLYEINGWSKTLPIGFKEGLELKDNFNKWIAKFPDRDVRLFVSAGIFQLSHDFWIETDMLSKTERMYLLCKNGKNELIKEWGKTFGYGNFKQEEDFEGLPENYCLFWFRNPTQGHSEIPSLTLYTQKRIELIGGLKVNFRTYINDFLPEVEIVNSDGNECVYLQYKGTNERIFLHQKQSLNNRWLLPDTIAINTDFYIRVEDENFSGNELAYNLISSENTAIYIDGSKLPKRDSFGRRIITDAEQYCSGSNIINPMTSSKRYSCALSWIFTSTSQETTKNISTAVFDNNNSNHLCSFLSLKGSLTTEDFFRAFDFFYSKELSEHPIDLNANLTKLKRASLTFYDFIGILDYDYETKSIVLNPPQLIFVPATQGRKVLLIGARDIALIESIINIAPTYNLQVEITKQFSSNARLLLPDVVTIKAFGTASENYGERNIKGLADELKITFSNDYFPQLALQHFSANITDYENTLQEIDEDDFNWARYVFNPETLRFEKSETENFDKSFSLLEYKLNEYTYLHKIWKDNRCFKIDLNWGRFIALKHYNKNVILFDAISNKVAIPIETPLPRLLSEAIMLLSGLAPDFKEIDGKKYRIYENVNGIFTQNLFKSKLDQTAINIII